ncbi:DUF6893 family small protein [Actinocrinis sp.]|jgi:hypothetical protein
MIGKLLTVAAVALVVAAVVQSSQDIKRYLDMRQM